MVGTLLWQRACERCSATQELECPQKKSPKSSHRAFAQCTCLEAPASTMSPISARVSSELQPAQVRTSAWERAFGTPEKLLNVGAICNNLHRDWNLLIPQLFAKKCLTQTFCKLQLSKSSNHSSIFMKCLMRKKRKKRFIVEILIVFCNFIFSAGALTAKANLQLGMLEHSEYHEELEL